jgi:5-methylcytosine-specific restriction enzyme A
MLSDALSHVANVYSNERAKPFAKSEFGNYVRHDLAIEAKQKLILWPFDLKVKASVGAGNWASVPWLGFFDPLVTESATKGYYVVYLINPQDQTIVLSMNQGTTDVYNEFGQLRGRSVLKRRAIDMAERVPEFSKLFSCDPIVLGSEDSLPAGYEAGHSFGRVYRANQVTEKALIDDLHQMLLAYEMLINRGGTTPTDVMQEESGFDDIEETRRYVLSRRIERSPKVRKAVLAARNPICECCGFDPVRDFGYKGTGAQTPLDVHHAAPLNGLAEGESKRYKVPVDFLVLCPTCHRMIHKQDDVSDLSLLKSKLRFKLMRETSYPML